MSMVSTPSLEPGARTLPIGLRDPRGNAYGWHRLHGNMAPVTEHPINLSGLGLCLVDPTTGVLADASTGGACNDGGYVDPSTIPVDNTDYSQAPYAIWTQGPTGTVNSQTMTAAQLAALISAGSASLSKILAVTQGGSVLANGSIIGSQGAAQLAASNPYLNVSTAGLAGSFGSILSNPIVVLGGLAIVAMLVLNRK